MDTPQRDALALAGTLCARVCHDLAGTLGALSGMLDMVAEAPDPEAAGVAQDCARELAARLRLLRAAWGSDSDVPDLATLTPGLPGAERLTVDLAALGALDGNPVRQLAANLMLVAAGGLPRGGKVWLSGGGRRIVVRIEGPRAAWPDALWANALEPRGVGAAMARLQAASLGIALRAVSETEIEVA